MRIELNGYIITKLQDGRYYVVERYEGHEFIVDELDEAMSVVLCE